MYNGNQLDGHQKAGPAANTILNARLAVNRDIVHMLARQMEWRLGQERCCCRIMSNCRHNRLMQQCAKGACLPSAVPQALPFLVVIPHLMEAL